MLEVTRAPSLDRLTERYSAQNRNITLLWGIKAIIHMYSCVIKVRCLTSRPRLIGLCPPALAIT